MSASLPPSHKPNVFQASRHKVQSCFSGTKSDSDLGIRVAPQRLSEFDNPPMQLGGPVRGAVENVG
jgi:hypothetical protein